MQPTRDRRAFALRALIAAAAAFIASEGAPAFAQAPYPNKPVRVVIPFPPGGGIDTFMRHIAPELSVQLGQPIVIVNKPGGGSQIAAAELLAAPADGYTVFVAQTGDYSVNPILYKKFNYIPARDFDGVAMLVRAPQVMLANVEGKVNSVRTLKEAMSAQGAGVVYGSFGPGTAPHILGHVLSRDAAGGKFTHIPYKGLPPAMQALMSKEVELLFDAVPGALNMMRTGKVVPLALAGTHRSPYLPNVPTTAEIGMPSLVMDFWIGAAVKKGTPRSIVTRLRDALEKSVSQPEIWKKFSDMGYSRASVSLEAFDNFIQAESEKMKPIIHETGVVVD